VPYLIKNKKHFGGKNMNMEFERKLTIPAEVKEQFPVTAKVAEIVEKKRAELKAIFEGRDNRKVLFIGPCSADNETAVLDYMNRLIPVQEKVKDKIMLVPRIYTNKPRTTGEGYKGLLHNPDPTGKPDMYKGILATRELHMKAVEQTGLIFADEMLYPENHKYLDDILGYVAVGARSVEDQQHRLTASGIVIKYRSIDLLVTVKGPPFFNCSIKSGRIEPREPNTLPNLTNIKELFGEISFALSAASKRSFSHSIFEQP